MGQKCVLVITDGIGYNANKNDLSNAFNAAKKPNYDWLFKNCPNTLLKTSGLAVGLPDGQMGNSEVGHMSIGAGRIIYQNLVKIDLGIQDGSLAQNENLQHLLKKCKKIHVIGLYSDGGVHSMDTHFNAICQIAQDNGCEVFAHAITDGRDTSPKSGIDFIKKLQNKFKIASISGRFYAMDRDKRWDRVKLAYETIVNAANLSSQTPVEYIEQSYKNDISDEFIIPTSFNGFSGIGKDDGVIFINFRNDRAKELTSAIYEDDFTHFQRKYVIKNMITMTEYDDKFDLKTLIKKENIADTLPEIISKSGLTQFHIAETEKYAHVTFFFNGGKQEQLINETRLLVPSPQVRTYDEMPSMSAKEVKDGVINAIKSGFDFIVVNFANGDMVGHTGNYSASIKAVEVVDQCIGEIVKTAIDNNYAYIQTSDHGNCEAMFDENNQILTNHTTFDVFCFVIANGVTELKNGCTLANIAPSVLKIMGLEIPKSMDKTMF